MPIDKLFNSFSEAVADIPDGAAVIIGGFGGPGGMPSNLILALRDHGARDLTVISNSAGQGGPNAKEWGDVTSVSILFANKQIRRIVASFPVSSRSTSVVTEFQRAWDAGEFELELTPQGTLAERLRAGGAGIPAFYTPAGVGTIIAEGKEVREFDGREYVLERALTADFALIAAHKADPMGNLVYKGSSRNFTPMMATAAKVTIVEVDEIVEPGRLDPEMIVTPGIYVQRILRIPKEGP